MSRRITNAVANFFIFFPNMSCCLFPCFCLAILGSVGPVKNQLRSKDNCCCLNCDVTVLSESTSLSRGHQSNGRVLNQLSVRPRCCGGCACVWIDTWKWERIVGGGSSVGRGVGLFSSNYIFPFNVFFLLIFFSIPPSPSTAARFIINIEERCWVYFIFSFCCLLFFLVGLTHPTLNSQTYFKIFLYCCCCSTRKEPGCTTNYISLLVSLQLLVCFLLILGWGLVACHMNGSFSSLSLKYH